MAARFSTWNIVLAAILKVWRQIVNPTPLSIDAYIYLKNNATKFHPDPILNDGALDFLKRSSRQEEEQDE